MSFSESSPFYVLWRGALAAINGFNFSISDVLYLNTKLQGIVVQGFVE